MVGAANIVGLCSKQFPRDWNRFRDGLRHWYASSRSRSLLLSICANSAARPDTSSERISPQASMGIPRQNRTPSSSMLAMYVQLSWFRKSSSRHILSVALFRRCARRRSFPFQSRMSGHPPKPDGCRAATARCFAKDPFGKLQSHQAL